MRTYRKTPAFGLAALLALMLSGCIHTGTKPLASYVSQPRLFQPASHPAAADEVLNLDGSSSTVGASHSGAACRSGFS